MATQPSGVDASKTAWFTLGVKDDTVKAGRSLQEIAAELERQKDTRKDYVAPQGLVDVKVIDGEVVLDGLNSDPKVITNYAHSQFGAHLDIPQRYVDKLRREQPDLLATNYNTLLHANPAEKRMFRTLDGRARAFLSPKYRPLDNFDLASAVLPKLQERGAQVLSAELTETRLYIKAILPDLSDELPDGLVWGQGHHIFNRADAARIVSAIVISNSEVGAGTLRVEPSVYTALCTNLAVLKEAAMRKYHVGRNFEADSNFEIFRDETRKLDDQAFWMKVQDVTMAAFSEERFKAAIATIRKAGDNKIESDDLPKVVEVAVKRLELPQSTQGSVLSWLAKGGQLNQWGLSSAITRAAADVESYETATDMERIGGEVLTLPAREWEAIATAA